MNRNHTEACYLFGEIVDRMFHPLVDMANHYRYIARALEIAGDQIAIEHVDKYTQFARDPKYAEVFASSRHEIENGTYKDRVAGHVHGELAIAQRRTASSTLVFAHAIFEVCVQDCLWVIYYAEPADWLHEIAQKKISIEQTTKEPLDDIQNSLISSLISGLEKQSLVVKLDTLFRVARPTTSPTVQGYNYDRERLQSLDEARHNAAHENPTLYDPAKLDSDLEYLSMTILYLLQLLIDRYKVRNITRPPRDGQDVPRGDAAKRRALQGGRWD